MCQKSCLAVFVALNISLIISLFCVCVYVCDPIGIKSLFIPVAGWGLWYTCNCMKLPLTDRWSQITDNGDPSVRPQALASAGVMTTLYYNLEGYNKVKHHAIEKKPRCHCPR